MTRAPRRRRGAYAIVAIAGAAWPAAAAAQLAASVAVASDVRLRGLSLSGGGAALTASLAYDSASGVYGGVTATAGDTRRFGPRFLTSTAYLGYAGRLTRVLSGEAGIIDTQARSNVFQRFSGHYTEVYAGLSTERLNARFFYAPRFFAPGLHAVYLDLNGTIRATPRLRLFGHGGVLVPVPGRGDAVLPRARYDLRLGTAVERGRAEFQFAWVRSGAGANYLQPRRQSADTLIAGASWAF